MSRTKVMQDFVCWAEMPSGILGNPSTFRASDPDIKTPCSGSQALSNIWFGCPLCWISCLQLISSDVQILAEASYAAVCFPDCGRCGTTSSGGSGQRSCPGSALLLWEPRGGRLALPGSLLSPPRPSPGKPDCFTQMALPDLVVVGG